MYLWLKSGLFLGLLLLTLIAGTDVPIRLLNINILAKMAQVHNNYNDSQSLWKDRVALNSDWLLLLMSSVNIFVYELKPCL